MANFSYDYMLSVLMYHQFFTYGYTFIICLIHGIIWQIVNMISVLSVLVYGKFLTYGHILILCHIYGHKKPI